MMDVLERAYFRVCLTLGWLLRSAKYSRARTVHEDGDPSTSSGSSRAGSRGECHVRKYRSFYAPLLVWLGGALLRVLYTGVRVLPQSDWQEREGRIYRSLYGTSIRIDVDGALVLPCLAGETLATLLDDPKLEESVRKRVIELAVVALAEFHRLGFTHGDAMAENVMVDLAPRRCSPLDVARGDPELVEGSGRPEHSSKGEAGVARWFDFETIHESSRPIAWRRADDVRALLVTCVARTVPTKLAETLQLILDVYADEGVTRLLAASFTSVLRRPLTFHLAQAGLSFQCFREIARLLRERRGESL
jgi:hypothetical protein